MSKKNAPTGISWAKATDELKAKIKFVLQQAQNNRYSVSRIYAAHNAVFELQEAPQTCSTCLTSRVAKLRKWWGEQSPKDTESVPTTGDMHTPPAADLTGEQTEADTYEGVVEKYKIAFDEASESETLENFIGSVGNAEAGTLGASMFGANELELLKQRLNELTAAKHETDLNDRLNTKLSELGINEHSSDADRLEAYQLLGSVDGNPEDEAAHYAAQAEVYGRKVADAAKAETGAPVEGVKRFDMGENVLGMDFTPSAEDATKGTVLNADGSKASAGTYEAADGTKIIVQMGGKARIETK